MLHKYVKTTQEYIDADATKQTEMQSESFEVFSTYVTMRGSDGAEYGSLRKGLLESTV